MNRWLRAVPLPLLLPAWVAYRRIRLSAFAMVGRNVLASGRHAPRLRQERQGLEAWLASAQGKRQLAPGSGVPLTLPSALAAIEKPPGMEDAAIDSIWSEILGGTYDLQSIDPRGAVVLDCGANIGLFSIWAFSHGVARVVAFEPSPSNRTCLEHNLAAEISRGTCTVIAKGVAAAPGRRHFRVSDTGNPGSHHVVTNARPGDIEIDVVSIDDTVEGLALSRLDFVKMDVEGSEIEALRGAVGTIRRFRPVLSVATEHTADRLANARAVIDTVRSIDPAYDHVATSLRPVRGPDGRLVLSPLALQFAAGRGRS